MFRVTLTLQQTRDLDTLKEAMVKAFYEDEDACDNCSSLEIVEDAVQITLQDNFDFDRIPLRIVDLKVRPLSRFARWWFRLKRS